MSSQKKYSISAVQFFEALSFGLISVYIFYLLFYNLSDFTGLHRDEAWFGLKAIQITNEGILSPHGMRYYTSSVYSIMVAAVFKWVGFNLFSLRLLSAIPNLLGLIIAAYTSYLSAGRKSLFIFLSILFSFSSFFLFSRIAWEVCTFNFFLAATQVHIIYRLIHEKKISLTYCFLFFFVTWFGFLNHIIFASSILAFLFSAITLNLFFQDKDYPVISQLIHLASLSLIVCIYLFILKITISDSFFQSHLFLSLFLFLCPVMLATIAFWHMGNNSCFLKLNILHQKIHNSIKNPKDNMTCIFGSLLCISPLVYIFVDRHIWGFLGTVTGTLPFQRILVHQLHPWVLGISHCAWLVILLVFFVAFLRKLSKLDTLSSSQRVDFIWYCYPFFSLLILSLFTFSTSSRHYLISSSLFLCCFPLVYKDIISLMKRSLLIIFLSIIFANILTSHLLLSRALLSDIQELPFAVTYRSFNDYSQHFYRLDGLSDYLEKEKVCNYKETNEFIQEPLMFLYQLNPYPCNRALKAQIEYCQSCNQPVKYFSIKIPKI